MFNINVYPASQFKTCFTKCNTENIQYFSVNGVNRVLSPCSTQKLVHPMQTIEHLNVTSYCWFQITSLTEILELTLCVLIFYTKKKNQ